jgi:hypothetical protein
MSDPNAGFDVGRKSRTAEKITLRFDNEAYDIAVVNIKRTLID